ncbi:MAG: hypothetical protein ACR2P7_09170, partial [bacterium]
MIESVGRLERARIPRVHFTADGKVIKIFRQKGVFTSNRIVPYARRFERNAARLAALGVKSVAVERVAKCRELDLHLAVYPRLPGASIRELAGDAEAQRALARLPGYLAELHRKGVYYKALHLGQILVLGGGGGDSTGAFALLALPSARFRTGPPSVRARLRNFHN